MSEASKEVKLQRQTYRRLALFLVVTLFCGAIVLGTLNGRATGPGTEYHAILTDSSGLREGDVVRSAGVPVGKVTGVELTDANQARVSFTANQNQRITTSTHVVVRYANMLGQRFLAVTQVGDPGRTLQAGTTIPVSRTAPALSLTDLFNGFQPIFASIDPKTVNSLSNTLVQVLQGQTSTIDDLIVQTAELSSGIADRDAQIGQIIGGFTDVMTVAAEHDSDLRSLLTSLEKVSRGLADDSSQISRALSSFDDVAASAGGLVDGLNDGTVTADVKHLRSVLSTLDDNRTELDQTIKGFPKAFADFARISQTGSWLNAYPCIVGGQVEGSPTIRSGDLAPLLARLGVDLPLLGELLAGLDLELELPLVIPFDEMTGPDTPSRACR